MKGPSSVLIVKTSSIGDVIQTFSALSYLRSKYPAARIDWVVEKEIAPLVRAHPDVDQVIEIDTKSWRKSPFSLKTKTEHKAFSLKLRSQTYDLLFDFQGNLKSSFVTVQAKASTKIGFGWSSVREKCNLFVTNQTFNFPNNLNIYLKYLGLVQSYFGDESKYMPKGIRLKLNEEEQQKLQLILSQTKKPILMVCFGSKWPNKQLDLQTLGQFLEKIDQTYNFSFLLIYGNEEEKKIAEQLQKVHPLKVFIQGNLSLPLWQALMWECSGLIAMDSAALHLCATTQTPSFSTFGPSLAEIYKPLGKQHVSIQGSCPYQKTFSNTCPILRTCSTGACIKQMQAADLFAQFTQMLDSRIQQGSDDFV